MVLVWFSGNSVENEKRGIPLKLFPFSRNYIFCGKTCTIWFPIGKSDFSIQMESARGIPFFSLLPEFPDIYVPFVHTYLCQASHSNTSEKEDLKDGSRFPKSVSIQYVSLLIGGVGGRFRTQLQPCRWKRITFCARCLCFFYLHDSGFQCASELHRGKTLWMLITGFTGEMWILQQPNRWNLYLLLQKIIFQVVR